MKVLGLDVGNAKVKLCLIDFQENLASSAIVWKSLPLPFSEDRSFDFRHGLPLQIHLWLSAQGLEAEALSAVVACSSHSYSYSRFHDSIDELAAILLKTFEKTPVFLVAADGSLTPATAITDLPPTHKYRYVLTNFVGSASLACRQIHTGLSIDIGTTTTDIIPIVEGRIDPVGLTDPDAYLRFRYQHQRIHWYGLTIIPLHMLADRVEISTGSFQVVPRNYRSDLIFSLLENDRALMREHAYDQLFPEPETARTKLCHFVGLDETLLSHTEINEIRDFLYQRMIAKVAEAIESVTCEVFGRVHSELQVAVYALGEQLLATPALLKAGFQVEQFRYLQLKRPEKLWSASSAFAMALLGLEHQLGQTLSLDP